MIFTNSELPLCLLNDNTQLNSFDFVLFHLYISNSTYKNYYLNLRKTHPERIMIFDNSAYEFFVQGKELDMQQFKDAIYELQPDFFLCPDVLMNKERTVQDTLKFNEWYLDNHDKIKSKPMGVLQGNSIHDFKESLTIYQNHGITHICLPFHNSFYKSYAKVDMIKMWEQKFGKLTTDMFYAAGRCQLILDMKVDLLSAEYVHLLGSHHPWEKHIYNIFVPQGIINSIDTGYPVKVGIKGWKLFEEPHKPDIIIDDFLTHELSDNIKQLIIDNVNRFKII